MANTRGTAMTIPQEFAEKIKRASYKDKIMSIAPILVLVAMILVFSLILGFNVFLAPTNIAAILKQLAIPLCVALGLTFVIMIGSIDLSIDGAVLAHQTDDLSRIDLQIDALERLCAGEGLGDILCREQRLSCVHDDPPPYLLMTVLPWAQVRITQMRMIRPCTPSVM